MELLVPLGEGHKRMSSLGKMLFESKRVSTRQLLSMNNFFWYEEAKKYMISKRHKKAAKLFMCNADESIATLQIYEDELRTKIIRGYIFCVSKFFYRNHVEKNKKFKRGIDYQGLFKVVFNYILQYKEILKIELDDAKMNTNSLFFDQNSTPKPNFRSIELIDRKRRKKSCIFQLVFSSLEVYFSSFLKMQICVALLYKTNKKIDMCLKILFSLDAFCNQFSFYFNASLLHLQSIVCSILAKILLETQTFYYDSENSL